MKKIDQENYRKCPEKQPEREKNPEKFQCCELEAEIEKGGTVEKGKVKEKKKFFEENDYKENKLLPVLTKPQVAPVKKLILEADKMLNLKKKSGNISTTEQERSEGNNLNMGISPRSKPLFSRKGKHETTGVKLKKLKMLFEGASPLKVRPNGIDFKFFAVESQAVSVSANGRTGLPASLGTD